MYVCVCVCCMYVCVCVLHVCVCVLHVRMCVCSADLASSGHEVQFCWREDGAPPSKRLPLRVTLEYTALPT